MAYSLGCLKPHPRVLGSITVVGNFFLFTSKYMCPFISFIDRKCIDVYVVAKYLFSLYLSPDPLLLFFLSTTFARKNSQNRLGRSPSITFSYLIDINLLVFYFCLTRHLLPGYIVSFKGKCFPGTNIKG